MANKKSIPEPENNKKDLSKEAAAAAKTTKDTGKKSSKKEETVDDFVAEQKAYKKSLPGHNRYEDSDLKVLKNG